MLADGYHDIADGKIAMVVTHLQMHAPPDLRPAPELPGVTFRKVAPDLDWFRDIFSRVGALDWLWFGRLRMSDAELSAIIHDPQMAHYTLTKDGKDEALLELDFRQPSDCELSYFGVTPAMIGSGAGRYLMNQAIRLAWERPIERFHVHTCTIDSPQALPFYIRSGFTPYRRQIEIDDDPRLSGLLPETAAPHVPLIRG